MAATAAGNEVTVLHDELIAIEGVAQAEVEIVDDGSPSVRLQVEPGADRRRVGGLVQQILAKHGLKSRLAPERANAELPAAPEPPSNPESAPVEPQPEPSAPEEVNPAPAVEVRRLTSVGVDESRRGVVVTVRDDRGGSVRAVGRPGRAALRDAVAASVFELVGEGGAPPSIVAIHRAVEGEKQMITVVLDRGAGDLSVGSAFVIVGWEYAFGRAVWAALTN
jgi:hypothetical protein